jgi:hypothetical protein
MPRDPKGEKRPADVMAYGISKLKHRTLTIPTWFRTSATAAVDPSVSGTSSPSARRVIRTCAAMWWRCGPPRYRRPTRRRLGGSAKGKRERNDR